MLYFKDSAMVLLITDSFIMVFDKRIGVKHNFSVRKIPSRYAEPFSIHYEFAVHKTTGGNNLPGVLVRKTCLVQNRPLFLV